MFSVCGCIWVIIVGGTAGFLAGQVIRGKGYNPIGNVLLGMLGFFVGQLIFGGTSPANLCGAILISFVGALILIAGVRIFVDKDFAK